MSTMKVGRVSCSNSSIMLTEDSSLNGSRSCLSRASGDAVRGMLDRSLLLPLALLVVAGGLRPLKAPLARCTVLMPPSSPCVLLSILAAASPLEKRGARWGRELREKKSGDGGGSAAVDEVRERSTEYRGARWMRRRLCRGSLAGEVAESRSAGVAGGRLFLPATTGGVCSATAAPSSPPAPAPAPALPPALELSAPRSSRRFGVHVGARSGACVCVCRGATRWMWVLSLSGAVAVSLPKMDRGSVIDSAEYAVEQFLAVKKTMDGVHGNVKMA